MRLCQNRDFLTPDPTIWVSGADFIKIKSFFAPEGRRLFEMGEFLAPEGRRLFENGGVFGRGRVEFWKSFGRLPPCTPFL